MSNYHRITDFSDPALDVYARLTENQLVNRRAPAEGLFIAESPKVIGRALDGGYEPTSLLVAESHRNAETEALIARCGETPVYGAPFELLTQLTGFKLTRGLLCAMRRKSLPAPSELCHGTRRIAVLENVMNPTNLGAIFRSAAALGMDAVLLSPGCSDPFYRRAARVSMGTVFQVPWSAFDAADWPDGAMGLLKAEGFVCAAMALRPDSLSLRDQRLRAAEKLAVFLGAEGDGLTDECLAWCEHTVCIPMSHGVDSLNVAAASALAFWELGQQS